MDLPKTLRENLAPLSALPRRAKQFVQAAIDFFAIDLALWLAFSLRLSHLWPAQLAEAWWLFLLLPSSGMLIFSMAGFYRIVLRGMGRRTLVTLSKGVVSLTIVLAVIAYLVPPIIVPRSVPFIFAISLLGLLTLLRTLEQSLLLSLERKAGPREPVVIYGAGSAGRHLATALERGNEFAIVGFVDDDPALQKNIVSGYPVFSLADLERAITDFGVKRILIAIPGIGADRRREIIQSIAPFGLPMQTIPSAAEVVAGLATIDQLRPVSPDDLLGRAKVSAQPELLETAVRNRTVLVTGAGGSIGSELCRQILIAGPRAIVLYEMSEFALYNIDEELRHLTRSAAGQVPIYPILGSVCDRDRIDGVFRRFPIGTVFHAAAYKHVPLVEYNVFEALRNNVIGTDIIAKAAIANGVEKFVLVSTDKAVRPASMMGATKRLAELVIHAKGKLGSTAFSIVRFGNVLASSGSVIPLFQKQIARGGPVTVTHREATRFFMTIPEAAQLVVQAAGLDTGGTFVLEMGTPVAIDELARRMINLNGLRLRDATDTKGDIEIVYTGLRPGEKLHEEVSISGALVPTAHPKIMKVDGEDRGVEDIDAVLDEIRGAMGDRDMDLTVATIARVVTGYSPSSSVSDLGIGDRASAELRVPS